MKHLINYNAPPAEERFQEVDATELAEIICELRRTYSIELDEACDAAALMALGAKIFVAKDEDGYCFARDERVRIDYYSAAGSATAPEYFPAPARKLDGTEYDTLDEARAAIHAACGNHGSWADDDAIEAWSESLDETCGGYCIVDTTTPRPEGVR